jgi:hypothetical protein
MKIPLSAFEAHRCTDSEISRYALGGVLFEQQEDGTPYAVGTDGRCLVALTWKDGDQKPGVGPTIIGSAVCRTLSSATKQLPVPENSPTGDAEVVMSNGGPTCKLSVGRDPEIAFNAVPIEGRFPKWRDVIPKKREGDRVLMLDHQLLIKVLETIAAHTCNSYKHGIIFSIPEDATAPVVIEAQDEDRKAIGVLMPIFCDSAGMEQWRPDAIQEPVVVEPAAEKQKRKKTATKAKAGK